MALTQLNVNLCNLAAWFKQNKLSLNLDKCKTMVFGTRHQQDRVGHINVHFDGKHIEQVQSFKYLGICLDSTLTFDDHVQYLKGKLYSKIKLLGRVCWL